MTGDRRPAEELTAKELLTLAILKMRGNLCDDETIIDHVAKIMAETLPERS